MELKIDSRDEKIPNVDKLNKMCTNENKLYAGGKFLKKAGNAMKMYFREVFNKIVARDFSSKVTIEFVNGSISEEDEAKMTNFADEVEIMNNRNVFCDEKEALEKSLKTTRMEEENQRKVVKIFEDWYEEFLVGWDEEHKLHVVDSIRKGQKEKMKLKL